MENNLYEAPKADLTQEESPEDFEFYVVSIKKFSILFLATFGVYSVYWFFRNWKLYKTRHATDMWPIGRAIFNIFFTHSLFRSIDDSLSRKGLVYKWTSSGTASLYVIFVIVDRVLSKLSDRHVGSPYTDVLCLLVTPLVCYILTKAQGAINLSQGDPKGESNAKISIVNGLWCIPGLVLWFFALVGLLGIFGVINLEV